MAKFYMSGAFEVAMRAFNNVLGLLMVVLGGIWILQGLNLAFRIGFMVNDKKWAVYGLILAMVGLCQIIWSNTRARYHRA